MPRPCEKDHPLSPDSCRLCWLMTNRPDYARSWGGKDSRQPSGPIRTAPPAVGPGTELKSVLFSLGVTSFEGCDCSSRAEQMDRWGVAGCIANKATIVGWLQEGQGRWGWKTKIAAAARAAASGLAFRLNPLDPIPGIVDEAIRRAEEKEKPTPPTSSPASSPPSPGVVQATAAPIPPLRVSSTPNTLAKAKAPLRWAYGVMTLCDDRERRDVLLPRTLKSLAAAGFDKPRLFVDGTNCPYDSSYWQGLETTTHNPAVRCAGNWVLSMSELVLREPGAERYAVFQDDFVTYRNLRQYLDCSPYPEKGYLNLYTFPSNSFPNNQAAPPADGRIGWYLANQQGKGAIALVFDRMAVLALLSARHLYERAADPHRGHRAIDGGVVTAMTQAGYREYVHNPSLVQHTGLKSTMSKRNVSRKDGTDPVFEWDEKTLATTFRGEDFDALTLLEEIRTTAK